MGYMAPSIVSIHFILIKVSWDIILEFNLAGKELQIVGGKCFWKKRIFPKKEAPQDSNRTRKP